MLIFCHVFRSIHCIQSDKSLNLLKGMAQMCYVIVTAIIIDEIAYEPARMAVLRYTVK